MIGRQVLRVPRCLRSDGSPHNHSSTHSDSASQGHIRPDLRIIAESLIDVRLVLKSHHLVRNLNPKYGSGSITAHSPATLSSTSERTMTSPAPPGNHQSRTSPKPRSINPSRSQTRQNPQDQPLAPHPSAVQGALVKNHSQILPKTLQFISTKRAQSIYGLNPIKETRRFSALKTGRRLADFRHPPTPSHPFR